MEAPGIWPLISCLTRPSSISMPFSLLLLLLLLAVNAVVSLFESNVVVIGIAVASPEDGEESIRFPSFCFFVRGMPLLSMGILPPGCSI